MKILLPTYKSIGWIVKAYAHLHEKYWGAPVVLLAEEDYSEGQFEFVQPPNNDHIQWLNGEIPAWHFTDVLNWYMPQIEDRHVLIMLADYLIRKPVDKERLLQLEEYMCSHDNILRGQAGDDAGYCSGIKVDTYKDIDIWEGVFLPTSLTPAIWNKDMLLSMMHVHDTPWGVEIKGQEKFAEMGWRSIAPSPGCIPYLNAIRGRDMSSTVLTVSVHAEVGRFMKIGAKALLEDDDADWEKGSCDVE